MTFDTSDRTKMMSIMMRLRQKTFPSTGDYVMARLKASAVRVAPVDVYGTLPADAETTNAIAKKVRKKKRAKKRPKKKSANKESVRFETKEPVLSFTEDHFPSLQDETVEWETERVQVEDSPEDANEDDYSEESTKNEEDEEEPKSARALSDAASTATTTSSTNTTLSASGFDVVPKKEGYAAVVRKATGAPSIQEVVASDAVVASPGAREEAERNPDNDRKAPPAAPPVVSITSAPQSSWGGSLSFVDVVRKQDNQ